MPALFHIQHVRLSMENDIALPVSFTWYLMYSTTYMQTSVFVYRAH